MRLLGRRRDRVLGLVLGGIFAMSSSAAMPATRVAPTVDHHVHLASPALEDYVAKLNKLDPSAFEHLSPDIFSRPTAATLRRLLDKAGVKRAVLLSSGYLFLTGGKLANAATEERELRDENRFVVDAARHSHGRFVAFVAVNPFEANADEELAYWKDKPGVSGIKLHLGAAGFHASSPEQVAGLAKFFAAAREANLPLVVHLRGAGPFPKSEVQTFIANVLSQAGDLPVQIAHGGGYGGADPATIDSLTAFGEAIARRAPGTKNLVFDISGVVMPERDAEALGSSEAQLRLFVAEMRRIGLDRFVMGSDWPAIGRIATYYALMRRKLPVTEAEWRRLCRNQAPYIRHPR
jgi:predicted TIM-barrel fold metal-dependent hydrolase